MSDSPPSPPSNLQQEIHEVLRQAIVWEVDHTKFLKSDPRLGTDFSSNASWSAWSALPWTWTGPCPGSVGKECKRSHRPNSNLTKVFIKNHMEKPSSRPWKCMYSTVCMEPWLRQSCGKANAINLIWVVTKGSRPGVGCTKLPWNTHVWLLFYPWINPRHCPSMPSFDGSFSPHMEVS